MDRHLLAVLKHRLDQRGAQDEYLAAIADYEIRLRQKPETRSRPCASGSCPISVDEAKIHRSDRAVQESRSVDRAAGDGPLPRLPVQPERVHRRLSQWPEAQGCMTEAVELAGSASTIHPLRAFTHEKAAWSWFERWHLSLAIKDFNRPTSSSATRST